MIIKTINVLDRFDNHKSIKIICYKNLQLPEQII